MEKHFLEEVFPGSPEFRAEPWYNQHGDCIVFQMADEAVVADRVDKILTIYRSAIDNRPIGYQIKGVLALIQKFGWDGVACEAEVDQGEISWVSVSVLLFAAYEEGPGTVNRRRAYASVSDMPQALRSIRRDELVPV